MNKRILYTQPNGVLAIIVPTNELPINVIARKDVPQGVAYKIVDLSEIEGTISDRTFRSAWEADLDAPDGYGDPAGYWAEKAAQ